MSGVKNNGGGGHLSVESPPKEAILARRAMRGVSHRPTPHQRSHFGCRNTERRTLRGSAVRQSAWSLEIYVHAVNVPRDPWDPWLPSQSSSFSSKWSPTLPVKNVGSRRR